MTKLLVAGLGLLVWGNSHALRCGTQIIDVGDSGGKVERSCPVSDTYRVENVTADVNKVYVDQNGMTYEVIVVDGKVQSIEGNR